MLTHDEERQIQRELTRYPTRRAACVEALKIIQASRGWVSDEALADVARALEMTPEELDAVATFYNMIFRKPVGRRTLLICDSVSCWIMGCDALFEHVQRRLGIRPGETTADGEFTLLPTVCLGLCDRAPAILVNEDAVGAVTAATLDDLIGARHEVRPRRTQEGR